MAKIKKDDLVQVISGKDKGKQGKVLRVFPTDERVLVEGVNRVTKHLRAGQDNNGSTEGGLQVVEAERLKAGTVERLRAIRPGGT